jgi:DNA recombination protein RmuC
MQAIAFLAFVFCILFGIGIGWFFAKKLNKNQDFVSDEQLQFLKSQIDQAKNDMQTAKADIERYRSASETISLEKAQLEEQVKSIPILESKIALKDEEMRQNQAEITNLKTRVGMLNTQLDAEKIQSEEKLKILLEAKEQMKTDFQNLANLIFDEKGKKLTDQNKLQLDTLLSPLKEQIQDFKKKVEDVYIQEGKERTQLITEIRHLKDLNQQISEDAENLTKALKSENKTMGNWGEVVLERVLELSGLNRELIFKTQETFRNEEGEMLRPDMIIKLPGDKNIIIDSKVSLVAYERYISATDENEKEAAFKAHILSIRTHIEGLSKKEYQKIPGLNTPDFVLLFIAVESAFLGAIEKDSTLFNDAMKKNIIIVCPSTLLIALRTINNSWQYEYQNRNSQEIAKRAGALYDKFAGFVESLQDVQKHILIASKSADKAMDQLSQGKGNLLGRVESIKKLGAKASKQINSNLVEIADEMDEAETANSPFLLEE